MNSGKTVRMRTREILEAALPGDRASRAFDIFMVGLIALNVAALILESVEWIAILAPRFFELFELGSVAVFTVEYILRIWSCTSSPTYARPVQGRVRFALTPLATIDLVAILPFYLPFLGLDLRFARALRLFRFLRIAKLGRYSSALQTLGKVAAGKKQELFVTFSFCLLLILFSSSAMYFAEKAAQPDKFSSIPAAMWWSVATLTTVGYGDVYPVTSAGKLIGGVIAILGIGLFALPTGILGAGFVEQIHGSKKCPHCGKSLKEDAG